VRLDKRGLGQTGDEEQAASPKTCPKIASRRQTVNPRPVPRNALAARDQSFAFFCLFSFFTFFSFFSFFSFVPAQALP